MARTRRKPNRRASALFFLVGLLLAAAWFVHRFTQAVDPHGRSHYIRFTQAEPLAKVLASLENDHVIRSAKVLGLVALMTGRGKQVAPGSYLVGPEMGGFSILNRLRHPVVLKVRLPETNWAARTARLLEEKQICSASDYMALVHNPAAFQGDVSFPLPTESLEGYLYPDTYKFEPLEGAKAVIIDQLKNFQKRVWDGLNHPANLPRVLTVASLVELEVNRDSERTMVASVIENRIAKHMDLQIDASVNYALGVWRPLKLSELKTAPGPYNLYTHPGLPPGPICSPTVKSIEAALNPAKTTYLFYVALPSGQTLFASSFKQHEHNIHLRKLALAQRRANGLSGTP